jgi:hypothetical protein
MLRRYVNSPQELTAQAVHLPFPYVKSCLSVRIAIIDAISDIDLLSTAIKYQRQDEESCLFGVDQYSTDE